MKVFRILLKNHLFNRRTRLTREEKFGRSQGPRCDSNRSSGGSPEWRSGRCGMSVNAFRATQKRADTQVRPYMIVPIGTFRRVRVPRRMTGIADTHPLPKRALVLLSHAKPDEFWPGDRVASHCPARFSPLPHRCRMGPVRIISVTLWRPFWTTFKRKLS